MHLDSHYSLTDKKMEVEFILNITAQTNIVVNKAWTCPTGNGLLPHQAYMITEGTGTTFGIQFIATPEPQKAGKWARTLPKG